MSGYERDDDEFNGDRSYSRNDEDEVLSKAETLGHYMAALNFSPKEPSRTKDTLEYVKTYSDALGRVGRSVVVVRKDDVGLEPTGVDHIVVTLQYHVMPDEDKIEKSCPALFRDDIRRILAHFQAPDSHNDIIKTKCTKCGMLSANFIEKAGKMMCLYCSRR